jgi:serine/threonine-protein kinase
VGRDVFSSDSIYDVLARHVGTAPEPPSAALGRAVSPDLEAIILRCLAKSADDRPAHAGALLEAFESCEVSGAWGQREARDWWTLWRGRHPETVETPGEATTSSHPSGYAVDIEGRLELERPPGT